MSCRVLRFAVYIPSVSPNSKVKDGRRAGSRKHTCRLKRPAWCYSRPSRCECVPTVVPSSVPRHARTRASQMALAAPRSLVTIADQMMHEEDIDADEYLWETLPGRCCFQELADDCDTCSVWSDPENFCHMSSDNCEHCGAALAPCGPVVSRTPAQRVRCSSQACRSTATRLRLYWMPTRFAKAIPRWG